LNQHNKCHIFIDLPIHKTEHPNNKYSIEDLIPILQSYSNVKYLAISNVESAKDLEKYLESFSSFLTLIPKIESPTCVNNIEEITNGLTSKQKIIILDHDDLCSSMLKKGEPITNFVEYINKLTDYCTKNHIIFLRTIGVIFSDDKKRVTAYIK